MEFKEIDLQVRHQGECSFITSRNNGTIAEYLKDGWSIVTFIPVENMTKVILCKQEQFDPNKRIDFSRKEG